MDTVFRLFVVVSAAVLRAIIQFQLQTPTAINIVDNVYEVGIPTSPECDTVEINAYITINYFVPVHKPNHFVTRFTNRISKRKRRNPDNINLHTKRIDVSTCPVFQYCSYVTIIDPHSIVLEMPDGRLPGAVGRCTYCCTPISVIYLIFMCVQIEKEFKTPCGCSTLVKSGTLVLLAYIKRAANRVTSTDKNNRTKFGVEFVFIY